MFNVPQSVSPSKFELSTENTEIGEAWQYGMRKKYAEQEAVFPYWQDYDLRVAVSVVREISFTQATSAPTVLNSTPSHLPQCFLQIPKRL